MTADSLIDGDYEEIGRRFAHSPFYLPINTTR